MKKSYIIIIAAVWSLLFMAPLFSTTSMAQQASSPIILKFADFVPQKSWAGQNHQWWADEVEKRSGGRVKIQFFWMESLVKLKDMLKGLQSGMTDIGAVFGTYNPSQLPMGLMLNNPMNLAQDYRATALALVDTAVNEPHLKAEYQREGVILLLPYVSGQLQMGTKKPFNGISDLKGQTIRSYGGGRIKMLEELGLNPIFLPYNDIYEAIDRGTINCSEIVMQLSQTFKHFEVMKYVYLTNAGGSIGGESMNLKVFNKLPKDIQKMLLELRTEYGARYAKGIQDQEKEIYSDWSKNYGVTVAPFSTEDRKLIADAAQKAADYMCNKAESEGHKGAKQVWAYYVKSMNKYDAELAKKK